MKKLKLDLDALRVESFRTAEPTRPRRGTVRAHGLWTFGFDCAENVQRIYTENVIPTDLCTLSCVESGDYPCGGN